MDNKQKFFQITGTFSITISIPADSLKEAKNFASEYFPQLITLDVSQLDKVHAGPILPVKRFKVLEINDNDLLWR